MNTAGGFCAPVEEDLVFCDRSGKDAQTAFFIEIGNENEYPKENKARSFISSVYDS